VPTQVHTCKTCEAEYEYGHKRGYCSEDCFYRERGESVIRQIKSDHTVCTSCFAKLKTVDTPPTETLRRIGIENGVHSKEALVGFQYRTPNMEREHGFTYCKCGNIDHYAEIDELRGVDLQDVLVNLWSLLREYYQKDQFGDNRPDKDILFDTLKESDLDFRLALGKSVYAE